MDERQHATLDRLTSSLGFLDSTPIEAAPPMLAKKRAALAKTIARIEQYAEVQRFVMIGETDSVERVRQALRRERMLPIVKVVRPHLRFAPGADRALRVPHARASASDVAAAALQIADVLVKHARLLKSAGIDRAFIENYRERARELDTLVKRNAAARKKRADASAGIAKELKNGLLILGVIGGLIGLHAPQHVAYWQICSGVKKKLGRPRKIRRRKPAAASAAMSIVA
jgi:hypothetical protein